MFIQNGIFRSIPAGNLTLPVAEGTVVTIGGFLAAADGSDAYGIVPETITNVSPVGKIYVAVGGTIDMGSAANKYVAFSEAMIKALGGDFNFVRAVETTGGGSGTIYELSNDLTTELTGTLQSVLTAMISDSKDSGYSDGKLSDFTDEDYETINHIADDVVDGKTAVIQLLGTFFQVTTAVNIGGIKGAVIVIPEYPVTISVDTYHLRVTLQLICQADDINYEMIVEVSNKFTGLQ